MAEKKLNFEVGVNVEKGIKNTEKLKNRIKDVEIQTVKVITAQQVLQGILTSSEPLKNLEKYIPTISGLVPVLGQIDKMNKEALTKASALSAARQKQIEAEIASLKKIPDNIIDINKAYEAKGKVIAQQSEIARVQALQEFETLKKNNEEIKKDNKEKGIAIVILEQQKADKMREIDNKLKEDLKKNAEELRKVQQELLNPVKDSKGFIDVDATRENVNRAVDALKKYKTSVLITQNDVVNSYNRMIEAAGDDKEKVTQLTKEKETALKNYGAQVKVIEADITKTQEKENDLRFKQIQSYLEYVAKQSETVKKVGADINNYFSQGFSAINAAFKAEIDAIEEEKNHYTTKKAAIDAEITESSNRQKELEDEKTKAAKDGKTERVKQLDEELTKHNESHNALVETQTKYQKKTEELAREKSKKAAEQEKFDKIRRKVELVKSIAEATANIAQGVTKAWAMGPFIGPILAAVVATAGAFQLKAMTAQLAKFADGGLLNGKRHSQGGMRIEGSNIEVEGGEYVVNRESTSKNLGLVRYINSERRELKPADLNTYFNSRSLNRESAFSRLFEDGGQLPVIENTANADNMSLIEAIQSIKIEPKVAVTDIHKVQDSMVSVDSWTGV